MLALLTATAAYLGGVHVVPCADNSFRVLVMPTQLSPAVEQTLKTLNTTLKAEGLTELPGAYSGCDLSSATELTAASPSAANGNLAVKLSGTGELTFTRIDSGTTYAVAATSVEEPAPLECEVGDLVAGDDLRVANMTLAAAARWCIANASCAGFTAEVTGGIECSPQTTVEESDDFVEHQVYFKTAGYSASVATPPTWRRWRKPLAGYLTASLRLTPGDKTEKIYGLGQTGFTKSGGCPPSDPKATKAVPLARNGQTITLLQTKFAVAIPVAFSSAGYGLLFHMPGCEYCPRHLSPTASVLPTASVSPTAAADD